MQVELISSGFFACTLQIWYGLPDERTYRLTSFFCKIFRANKCDLLKASYVHRFHQPKKITVGAEITRRFSTKENTFTVAGSCKVDKTTTLKVKVNNHGKLDTLLLHKIRRKFSLSISSEFDTKALDKVPRIGLALALNPHALNGFLA